MTTNQNLTVAPFTVAIAQDAIDDLNRRLANTRYAATPTGDGWQQGTPVDYLTDLVGQWQSFDWRAVEDRLNAWPQFTTELDGQNIHFLHVRSSQTDAIPLLLVHTYPGSILDFADLIEPLTEPADGEPAFHLVIPSLPGMGFSTPLADGDWTTARLAGAFDTLMRGLGYDSYGAHGSDGGALVSRELAKLNPAGFLGAHVLQLFSFPSGDPAEFESLTPADHSALEFMQWFTTVNGYADLNGKRPLTIAAALSDSPVGQLAYHELFANFGNGTSLVSAEQILAQASLQWLTNTSAGVARFHYTERNAEPGVNEGPIGIAVFADDFRSIKTFAQRDNTNIVSWTEHPRGGHFAAMEVPDELAAALRIFFASRV